MKTGHTPSVLSYFRTSLIISLLGLILCGGLGFFAGGSWTAVAQTVFVGFVLAVLEVSLSFDNAIVNALVLKKMTPLWRRRFITWGMLIAVFGMRLIFPLLIVAVMAKISPWQALVLAATDPNEYATRMLAAHLEVAAFGGSFLLLVALHFFYDEHKESHWFHFIEKQMVRWGRIRSIEIGLTLLTIIGLAQFLPDEEKMRLLMAGLYGVIVYIVVDGVGSWLELSGEESKDLQRASAGMFLYLEVLDASFSFDGVIGAFAITQSLFVIMVGLSIGAFFVRSLTILFVEKDTLSQFDYLEHGAFYAIFTLAMMMLLDPFLHFPEWVTGLSGAVIIGASFYSSLSSRSPSKQSPPN